MRKRREKTRIILRTKRTVTIALYCSCEIIVDEREVATR
jgi:hypothetical protein